MGILEVCGSFLRPRRSLRFLGLRSEESSEEQMESYFDLVKRFTTKKTLPVVPRLERGGGGVGEVGLGGLGGLGDLGGLGGFGGFGGFGGGDVGGLAWGGG